MITLEIGHTYRLRRDLEVRDEKTGTIKQYLRAGTLVKPRRLDPDDDHVYLEGLVLPVPLSALSRMVDATR